MCLCLFEFSFWFRPWCTLVWNVRVRDLPPVTVTPCVLPVYRTAVRGTDRVCVICVYPPGADTGKLSIEAGLACSMVIQRIYSLFIWKSSLHCAVMSTRWQGGCHMVGSAGPDYLDSAQTWHRYKWPSLGLWQPLTPRSQLLLLTNDCCQRGQAPAPLWGIDLPSHFCPHCFTPSSCSRHCTERHCSSRLPTCAAPVSFTYWCLWNKYLEPTDVCQIVGDISELYSK